MVARRSKSTFGDGPSRKTVLRYTRAEKALKLRRAGYTPGEIVKRVPEYDNVRQVRADLRTMLRQMVQEPAQELIALQYHRLEQLLRAIWREAMAGDLGAHDRILKLIQEENKLLKLGAQGEDGASDVERWLSSLIGRFDEARSEDLHEADDSDDGDV